MRTRKAHSRGSSSCGGVTEARRLRAGTGGADQPVGGRWSRCMPRSSGQQQSAVTGCCGAEGGGRRSPRGEPKWWWQRLWHSEEPRQWAESHVATPIQSGGTAGSECISSTHTHTHLRREIVRQAPRLSRTTINMLIPDTNQRMRRLKNHTSMHR